MSAGYLISKRFVLSGSGPPSICKKYESAVGRYYVIYSSCFIHIKGKRSVGAKTVVMQYCRLPVPVIPLNDAEYCKEYNKRGNPEQVILLIYFRLERHLQN